MSIIQTFGQALAANRLSATTVISSQLTAYCARNELQADYRALQRARVAYWSWIGVNPRDRSFKMVQP